MRGSCLYLHTEAVKSQGFGCHALSFCAVLQDGWPISCTHELWAFVVASVTWGCATWDVLHHMVVWAMAFVTSLLDELLCGHTSSYNCRDWRIHCCCRDLGSPTVGRKRGLENCHCGINHRWFFFFSSRYVSLRYLVGIILSWITQKLF